MSKTYEALKKAATEREMQKNKESAGRELEIEETLRKMEERDAETREVIRQAMATLAEVEGRRATEPEATPAPAPVETAVVEAPKKEPTTPVKSLEETEDEGWKMNDEETDPEEVARIAEIEKKLREKIAEDEEDAILEKRLEEALQKKMRIKKVIENLRKER